METMEARHLMLREEAAAQRNADLQAHGPTARPSACTAGLLRGWGRQGLRLTHSTTYLHWDEVPDGCNSYKTVHSPPEPKFLGCGERTAQPIYISRTTENRPMSGLDAYDGQ